MRVDLKMENKLDLYNGMGVELVLSAQNGLSDDYKGEQDVFILTNKNLIARDLDDDQAIEYISFIKISCIDLVRLSSISKSKKPLLKVVMLLLGAWVAFDTINLAAVSIILTSVLSVWGVYNLVSFFLEDPMSKISFVSGNMELGIQFHNKLINDVYMFMDKFFELRDVKSDTEHLMPDLSDN